jgi:quercetin dioxygenase-like cupin family protein
MTVRGSFHALEPDQVYDGVVRRSFSSAQATIMSYSFAAGAQFPVHRHPQEQVTLVQSGEIEMTIGARRESLSAGDWTIAPPEVEHGITAGGDGASIIAIVVPRRAASDAYTVVDVGGDQR